MMYNTEGEFVLVETAISFLGDCFLEIMKHIFNFRIEKVKLNYSLQIATDTNETESSLRTKYSESDYCLQIYNTSSTPYILKYVSLRYEKHIITDCILTEEITLRPYEKYVYRFSEQEYDTICWHCEKSDLKNCKAIAYDINNKKSTGKLDLILPYLQSHMRDE